MICLDIKLRDLKLKKALLFDKIESVLEVEESLFLELGKLEAELLMVQKKKTRATVNPLG